MTTDSLGLYVHIPFCVRKCNYCDFCSFPYSGAAWRDEYISALCSEIRSYSHKKIRLNSIFFGGGTPSLLTSDEFCSIFAAIQDTFEISPGCEFTVEANPKTLSKENLDAFRKCGVNRLSIGLQSIHENELKKLGRIHNFEEFLDSYNLARSFGFNNINIDLMYGIPEQTIDSFRETLKTVHDLSPTHISVYGLIIEEGTPFYKSLDSLTLPNEDIECEMYYLAADFLKANGYSHYEISNYSRPGYECRHNLKYWRCDEYIGVGLAAYSYFGSRRYGNTNDPRVYLQRDGAKYEYDEVIGLTDAAYEYAMLGLRLAEGFSLSDYRKRFGEDFYQSRSEIIDSFIREGYLLIENDRIFLTERGFYVSNAILTELI